MQNNLKRIVEPLITWFHASARILPWRERPEPYRVWVSEIMLQQTRVEAVKPYFERFMEALPDVESLAEAEEETLLKLWEGLGYYNRVRNMQKAAIQIMERHGGELPADYDALCELSGIGSYTAGAIASIAYGLQVPAVDGNVLRVISRIQAWDDDITKASVKKNMEKELLAIMPKEAGAFNQALMELGAMVCIPNGKARCESCPLAECCLAKQKDIVDKLPVKSPKKQRRIEKKTLLLLGYGEVTAIRKRNEKGLLAGMYEFPFLEGWVSKDAVTEYCREMGNEVLDIRELPASKHIFSHVEWHMKAYGVEIRKHLPNQEDLLFVTEEETNSTYPIPAAFAAYRSYLNRANIWTDKMNKNKLK